MCLGARLHVGIPMIRGNVLVPKFVVAKIGVTHHAPVQSCIMVQDDQAYTILHSLIASSSNVKSIFQPFFLLLL